MVSVLHGGGELEVGDADIVVTAVQEDVGLRGRGDRKEGRGLSSGEYGLYWTSSQIQK